MQSAQIKFKQFYATFFSELSIITCIFNKGIDNSYILCYTETELRRR